MVDTEESSLEFRSFVAPEHHKNITVILLLVHTCLAYTRRVLVSVARSRGYRCIHLSGKPCLDMSLCITAFIIYKFTRRFIIKSIICKFTDCFSVVVSVSL